MSGFIVDDDDDCDNPAEYDPLDTNDNYFKKKRYVYKEYSSASEDVSEANYDQIEEEEFRSGVIGEMEDAEQLAILMQEEKNKRQRRD